MKTKVAALGLLFLAALSGVELGAVRYNALFGGTYPGVQLPDEEPDCWFSFAEKQAIGFVKPQSSLSLKPAAYNEQEQLTDFYATGTHIVAGGNQIVTVHLFNAVRNANNKITGWTETRFYDKSKRLYVFIVSGVRYDINSGIVLSGYGVNFTVNALGVKVSGNVTTSSGTGIADVAVTGQSIDFQSTVRTNANGLYEIVVPSGWGGTLTPAMENYRFTPTSKSYASVTQPLNNQNFTGTPIQYSIISGVVQDSQGVGIAGVSLDGFPEAVTTDSSGVYSGRVESGTTPVIRPVKACFAFTPAQRTYPNIGTSLVNQDYTGARTGAAPDVKGMTFAQAEAAILAAGLEVGMVHYAYSPTAAAGTVLRQSPAAGICGNPTSPVHLAISLGSRPAGLLKGWGSNASNILSVPAGMNFVAVAGGGSHAVALKNTGALAAWGNNASGQCTVPAGVFENIACGAEFSVGVKSDGTLVAWGKGTDGQTTVPTGNTFIAIGTGDKHGLAVRVDGSIAAWGSNTSGQCTVPAGFRFLSADGGELHSVALMDDFGLKAWGANDSGQCDIPNGNDFVAVAAGARHNVALRADGTLAAWGANGDGQCDVPAGNNFVAVAAGKDFSAALTTDGSVIAWGKNDMGQSNAPDNLYMMQMDVGTDFGAGVFFLRADLDGNASVDEGDLAALVPAWMNMDCQAPQWCGLADMDHDGRVDIDELAILSREWMMGVSAYPTGLIAHWPMDDNAAGKTVLDAGDNHLNGAAQRNTSLLTMPGVIGTALSFNGTTDWIDCGTHAALLPDAWTLCAWVKCTNVGTPMLISFGGSYPSIKLQNTSDGKPRIHLGQSNYRYFAASAWTTLKDGQWHHVAFTVPGKAQTDATQAQMYVDGLEVAGDPAVTTGAQAAKTHVYLGANPPTGTQRFGGAMDDVMLFNSVLTEGEIRKVMDRTP